MILVIQSSICILRKYLLREKSGSYTPPSPRDATCLINKRERERERERVNWFRDSSESCVHSFISLFKLLLLRWYIYIYILQTGSEVNRLLWGTIQTSGKEEYYILYFHHNARSFLSFIFLERVFHFSWEPTEILTTTHICWAHFITRSSNLTWLSLLL